MKGAEYQIVKFDPFWIEYIMSLFIMFKLDQHLCPCWQSTILKCLKTTVFVLKKKLLLCFQMFPTMFKTREIWNFVRGRLMVCSQKKCTLFSSLLSGGLCQKQELLNCHQVQIFSQSPAALWQGLVFLSRRSMISFHDSNPWRFWPFLRCWGIPKLHPSAPKNKIAAKIWYYAFKNVDIEFRPIKEMKELLLL